MSHNKDFSQCVQILIKKTMTFLFSYVCIRYKGLNFRLCLGGTKCADQTEYCYS